ncbi:MAG: ROK family protein [Treponema sp.]|jgi:glucokinase|nr:ROK family protein [Treponema sp.]
MVFGVDIGGTQIRAALFDDNYTILHRVEFPNNRSLSAETNLEKITAFINTAKAEDRPAGGSRPADGGPVRGIGMGCPGPLDFRLGKILNPPNLYGWNDFEIVRYFEEKTGFPAALTNDANAAGLAEARLGAGRGCESVFYITVSTGVGGAYIYRGELVTGAHSAAAEVYNLMVCEDPYCHRGANPGSLNEMCGGDALARQGTEAFGRPVDAKELYEELYLKEKDPRAAAIVERCADNLARGIGNIACVADPDIFVFGGSIALRSPVLLALVEARAKRYMIRPEYLCLRSAQFGGDAGLIGAAMLAEHLS